MTTPDLGEVVAGVIREHVVGWQFDGRRSRLECDCGAEVIAGDGAAHQARAVLDALTEAGTVQFGVRWHVGGCSGINRCTSKRHAERQAAKLVESGHEAVLVSRLTFPWTAAE